MSTPPSVPSDDATIDWSAGYANAITDIIDELFIDDEPAAEVLRQARDLLLSQSEEIKRLRDDIERHLEIASTQATELASLRNDTIEAERKRIAAYLEMALGCGNPECRSCTGKQLADAILAGEHDPNG